jgi:aminopeptidase N
MRKLLILATVIGVAGAGIAIYLLFPFEPPAPDAGVAQSLAQDRAHRVADVKYDLSFTIPAGKTTPIAGRAITTFTLNDAGAPLALDFAQTPDHLHSVLANTHKIDARIQNGHIVIPSRMLVKGENTIAIEFTAGNESLNRNDDFLYTLFVPARASLALPCFDQPDLKARWRLMLTLPPTWTAVSNGRETGRISTSERVGLMFEETQPLPTYLFAFAAGMFSVETAERNGRQFRMFHRESDTAKVARNRDAIFDLHARALAWLEEYTGIPYPFGKFDFVLIPSFQFGGMEHAGAIYYNASSLMLDESATQNQLLGRANVISHETSHIWFGDLVTMRWFNDVWMKEVFANFMAAKIVNPSFPQVNHELRFLLQNYPTSYDVDRTAGANPIRQELANLNEAGSLYGAIIYQKAPIVMRQLELLVGADSFREGLRTYLKRYSFKNATWLDLVEILSNADPSTTLGTGSASSHPTKIDLAAWSHAWVDLPGRPEITTLIDSSGGRIDRLAFDQVIPEGGVFKPERLHVALGMKTGVRMLDVTLAAPHTDVPEAAGVPAPDWLLPVGDGLGYGSFNLDPVTLDYLTHSLHAIADPLTRGAAMVALWESMLDGKVLPVRVFAELLVALPAETNELNTAQLLDYTRAMFWRFTPAEDREAIAGKLESELRAGLSRAATTSLKAAWFNALRSIATTPPTITWLDQVWRHDVKIEGLPLSEADEADLALDLAVRGVIDARDVLTTELNRIKNADRKARFAFVTPAVSADAAVRDAFFDSLKDVKNRAHEAWVLDAVRYLNHPLRAAGSAKYIPSALDLVREIQRTGDIFFPKRWTDASLGGYQSPQDAATVRAFIEHLPEDYPPRLRWVLLSSADQLFRAAGLTK